MSLNVYQTENVCSRFGCLQICTIMHVIKTIEPSNRKIPGKIYNIIHTGRKSIKMGAKCVLNWRVRLIRMICKHALQQDKIRPFKVIVNGPNI